jgi:hypothetical protein
MSNATAYGLDAGREGWRYRAACAPQTAHWFEVADAALTADNHRALEVCRRCPVRQPCREYEDSHPSPWSRIAAGRVWRARRRKEPP